MDEIARHYCLSVVTLCKRGWQKGERPNLIPADIEVENLIVHVLLTAFVVAGPLRRDLIL